MNNRRISWSIRRGLVTLLVGATMLGLAVLNAAAQGATPITDVTPEPETTATSVTTVTPESTQTTLSEAGEVPSGPEASPEARAQAAQLQALQVEGTVVVTVVDENDDPLPGACLTVWNAPNNTQPLPANSYQCDGRDDGADDGVVTFGLSPGDYFVIASFSPDGYISGTQVAFTIVEGTNVPVTLKLEPGGRTVLVNTVNEESVPVGPACFSIFTNAGGGQPGAIVSSNCDAPEGDPGDGSIYFPGIAAGDYVAVETRPPSGYLFAANTPLSVPTSGTDPVNVTVVHQSVESPGNLIVKKVDENDSTLPGACFAVWEDVGGGQRGNFVVQRCDFEDGYDGQLVYTGLVPGNYVLVEYHAPDGYLNGVEQQVSVSADVPTVVAIPNTPGGSNITIHTIDIATDETLVGACYVVYHDDGSGQPGLWLEGRCDDSDGVNDGITPFTGLPAGDYVLVQNLAPDGYNDVEPIPFSVDGSTVEMITVENTQMTLVEQIVEILIRILQDILAEQ